ncbi:MAG: cytochrome c4 [Sulfuricellaceae bacterium]|nr:cytochrome c4 [Sulfuricellaceae bacterium]
MKPLMAMALATGLLAASPAMAENALSKADPAKAQQIVNTVCIACHGADGNSVSSANPKLAGQHSEYLLKQLQNFKSGERKNPIMSGMVATLTPEDMQNLAAYFNSQKTAPGQAKDPALLAMGEKLYRGGNTNSGVAACAGCHSPNGAGIPALFPRLAGQHADYVVAQLKAFRTSERANDPGKMMQTIAVKMTEKEMTAVAEYITALH